MDGEGEGRRVLVGWTEENKDEGTEGAGRDGRPD